jgi:hypothetical protein
VRLWSLHPRLLDRAGLVAVWREGLLAQAVLRGRTKGYRHHPQLDRFRRAPRPLAAIGDYLRAVHDEARRRGYSFDRGRITRARGAGPIRVTRGQLTFEAEHLRRKLARRDRAAMLLLPTLEQCPPHPLFRAVFGCPEPWERAE